MAKNIVIVGTQWGDEGKGKIVDLLSEKVSAVVRFQGGHNAGHTLVIGDRKVVSRLVPSGILRPTVQCYIGNGVVLSPQALIEEIEGFEASGMHLWDRIHISAACTLILPYHIALDAASEAAKGRSAIGTTGRGIGPAYADKAARRGLRVSDLLHPERFAEKLKTVLDFHNFVLEKYYQAQRVDYQQVLTESLRLAEQLIPMIVDVPARLAEHKAKGEPILFEGAQGTFLDIDLGTYPFVTSSNTTTGSVTTGSGFGPCDIDYVLGITKVYTTRVGSGPFPAELKDDIGQALAERGHEFGSNTGRPRRCGWFDAVMLRRAAQLNSLSGLCLTKLDVLDGFEQVKICVAYELPSGERVDLPPFDAEGYYDCQPVYETLPGWQQSTAGITEYDKLPSNAQTFLARIAEATGVPVAIVSTGPDRDETIILDSILSD